MEKSIQTLKKEVAKVITKNRGLNDKDRSKVLRKNNDLLKELEIGANRVAKANKAGSFNQYELLLTKLTNWVLNARSTQKKRYKSKLKPENPSEIKDNMKTNNRINSTFSNNHYIQPKLKPTDAEKEDPVVKQHLINIEDMHDRIKRRDKHSFQYSTIMRQMKDDLKEKIKSIRGINHQGRTDNTPSPISHDHKYQFKELAKHSKIAKEMLDGYSESEIARMHEIYPSTVLRKLRKLRPLAKEIFDFK